MTIGSTPSTTQAYGEAWYWDNRYSNVSCSGPFDWYQKYHALAPIINLYIPRHNRVLIVGCGNSCALSFIFALIAPPFSSPDLFFLLLFSLFKFRLYFFRVKIVVAAFSEGMSDDGYGDLVNIDISSVVVQAMRLKYSDRPRLKCILSFFPSDKFIFLYFFQYSVFL